VQTEFPNLSLGSKTSTGLQAIQPTSTGSGAACRIDRDADAGPAMLLATYSSDMGWWNVRSDLLSYLPYHWDLGWGPMRDEDDEDACCI